MQKFFKFSFGKTAKLLVLIITSLFFLVQVHVVLAGDSTVVASQSVTQDAPTTVEDSNVGELTETSAVVVGTDQAVATKTALQSAQNISSGGVSSYSFLEPKNVVYLPDANLGSGALNQNFPIKVPPGRNGMQPDLNLQYSSQNNDNDGVFGYGWNINIPFIERVNRYGVDTLYTGIPIFYSSLSGELVSPDGITYSAKVEDGDFAKYSFVNNTWLVIDKKGTVYKYGIDFSAQQYDVSSTDHVYKWMLQEVRDLNGNYVKYQYFQDNGQIYPSVISYTGNGTTDGPFTINFLRESRSDVISSFKTGFKVLSQYRINEIDININGAWSRKYLLGYTVGDDGDRSLLSSLTEQGKDDSLNVVSLPPTTFSYSTSTVGFTDQNLQTPESMIDTGVMFGDVNGDGLQDILRSWISTSDGTTIRKVYLNDGLGGWNLSATYTIPVNFLNANSPVKDQGSRVVDLNGDGLDDIVGTYSITGAEWNYINSSTISNWGTVGYQFVPPNGVYITDSLMGLDTGTRLVDVNGDGLMDIVAINAGRVTGVYLNTGNGYAQHAYSLPTDDRSVLFADVNGDNLVDIVEGTSYEAGTPSSQKIYLNNGQGWVYDSTLSQPVPIFNATAAWDQAKDLGARIADVNGDGLPDALLGTGAYLNNGHGFGSFNGQWATVGYPFADPIWNPGIQIVDVDGDGFAEVVKNGTHPTGNTIYKNNTSRPTDLLVAVKQSTGGTTQIEYKSSPTYRNGSNLANPNLPLIVNTVSKITSDNGLGVTSTNSFKYEGGRLYYDSPYDRKFAGFNKVTKTNSSGNYAITYYHQGDASDLAHGEYNDSYYKIGKPFRSEAYDYNGNLYAKTINKWDEVDLGNGSHFVKLAQVVNSTYDGTANHRDKASTYTYDNTTGNITQKVDWGEVQATDDGSFSDIGSDRYTTNVTFAASTSSSLLGFESEETMLDQNNNIVKDTKYYYDNLPFGSVGVGNETREDLWKSGSSYATTQKAYNSYGLVTQSTDARGKNMQYVYDPFNLYPATTTDPLGHTRQFTYNYYLGKPKQTTDENNLVFQTQYDGLNRVVAQLQPDLANPGTLVTKSTIAYTPQTIGMQTHEVDYLDGSTGVDSYTYSDGFDRTVQKRAASKIAGTFIANDTVYNALDQVDKQSLPYFSSGSAQTSPTGDVTLYTSYTYDPILRVASVGNAVGTTYNTYNNWKLTVTDPRGNTKGLYKDAFDNLVRVDENMPTSTFTTTYTYDGLKDLTNLTDALGNVRNFTYDGLGRRLTAEDLHASTDAYFGKWNYTYDDNGNLTQQVNPRNQTTTFSYDDGNRPLTEDYLGVTGTELSYAYDSCTLGIGRLCTVTSTSAVDAFTYTALGAVATTTRAIGGGVFATGYSYDRLGNLLTVTNPDNSQIKYVYDVAGQLYQVQRKESKDSGFTAVITNLDYSPLHLVTNANYANGVTTTNTYDATKLYRLSAKTTTQPNSTRTQDLAYTYDANGNITHIVDNSATNAKKTMDYTYDAINRLTSASSTGAVNGQNYLQTYTYDALGNLLYKSDVGTYMYTGNQGVSYANPDAPTVVASTTYTYDNDGNLLTDGKWNYTWDWRNRLMQSTTGTKNIVYTYDDKDSRTLYVTNGVTTTIISKYYELTGNTTTKYVYAGDQLVATVVSSTWVSALTTTSTANFALSTTSTSYTTGYNAGPVTKTWTHTVNSSNTLFVLYADILQRTSGTGTITSSTLNGVLLTKATSTYYNKSAAEIWYIVATSTGTKTVSVKVTGATDAIKFIAATFTGSATSAPLDGFSSNKGSNGNPTVSTTSHYLNDLITDTLMRSSTVNATTSLTVIVKNNTTSTLAVASYRAATSTGVYSDTYTGSTTQNWVAIMATFKPLITTQTSTTSTSAFAVYYVHPDHLGGTALLTDQTGTTTEVTDYYPFGGMRVDDKPQGFSEKKKFTGHEYDQDTNLNYFGARYQDGTRGQFLSQDPAFLAVGDINELKKQTKLDQVGYLSNPQNLNSYSYATNNPLTKVDQNGKFAFLIPAAIYIADTAPIWVPAAITGVSAIGATVATWHWGQEVGYLSAGDYKAADKSSSAVENTLTATLGGVGGVMEAASLFSPFASQETEANATISKPYSRPANATTQAQRASVQGKSCATCGTTAPVMYADHKTPLVQEYYGTGKINLENMRNINAVQPQCPSCSNIQGGMMSNYSKQMKVKFGL